MRAGYFGPFEQAGCLALMLASVGGATLFALWAFLIYRPPTSLAQATPVAHGSAALDSPSATPAPALSSTATPSPSPSPTLTPTATPTSTPLPALPPAVLLTPMSHEYQKLNNCGPASLAMAASFFGVSITQFDAADAVKGSPEDKNVSPQEMVDYLHSLGLGAVYRVNGNEALMKRLLANDLPVIVHQWLVRPQDGVLVGHYRVLRGYNTERGLFIANDPYTGPEFIISFAQFEEWWRPFNRGYIPIYRPDQAALVAAILGDDWNEEANHRRALAHVQAEAQVLADGYAFFNLGNEYLALGDPAAATEAYNTAFTFEFPDHFLWYQFGPLEAFNQVGEYQRVLDMTGPLIVHAGELEEARFQRGLAYLGLNNPAAARAEFEQALAANPRFEKAAAALDRLNEAPSPN